MKIEQGTKQYLKSYLLGFALSLALTLGVYFLVTSHLLTQPLLTFVLMGLALIQMSVQLLLFLHLGKEKKPRLHLLAFFFMLLVLVIIVFGSLWIMNNLNYNVMPHH